MFLTMRGLISFSKIRCRCLKHRFVLCLMAGMLAGCFPFGENDIEVDDGKTEEIDWKEKQSNNLEDAGLDEEALEQEMLKEFRKANPDAEAVNHLLFDITNDGVKDLVIIFSSHENSVNFGFVSEGAFYHISFGDYQTKLQFANGSDSIKTLENPNRVIISVMDPGKNAAFDLEISVDINKELNRVHYTVKSREPVER